MFNPSYPPYDPRDRSGFAYDTVLRRWPIIITNVIDSVHREIHNMTMESKRLSESIRDPGALERAKALDNKVEEAKDIIAKASRLKYRMARDGELEPIPEDGDVDVEMYNAELARLVTVDQNTWFSAPWLFAECYLYRLFRSYFSETHQWRDFDPFFGQKEEMFKDSAGSIHQIATTMHQLFRDREWRKSYPDILSALFREMIHMCLWGNASDLSLLTDMKQSDMERLQEVLGPAQMDKKEFVLKDDQEALWQYVKTSGGPGKRCDFILDNAGFELFTDLVFADFLVTYTPYFSKVVFHPKLFPWFVSDVTPTDFKKTITSLLSTTFFPPSLFPGSRDDSTVYLHDMVTRWETYLEQGIFVLSTDIKEVNGQEVDGLEMVKFWTEPWPYWNMKERAGKLWSWLHGSDLVIFKGDLNYRKLAGDVKWPVSTSFSTAIGPLAGSFPILSLRTCKADVAVGVSEEVADELDRRGEKWRVSGKYALVSFEPRAV